MILIYNLVIIVAIAGIALCFVSAGLYLAASAFREMEKIVKK